MDASTSITWSDQGNWDRMKNFVSFISQAFPVSPDQTRIGIVKFSTSANVEFALDRYTTNAQVAGAINNLIHTGGETNIPAALALMRTAVFNSRGDRRDVKNIAIVITDGQANINPERVTVEAQNARDDDIEIFSIGITQDVILEELQTIASDPDRDHVFQATDFKTLETILADVIRRACEVAPTFEPTTPSITPSRVPPTRPGGRNPLS